MSSIVGKIAVPCGIVGGTWALVAPVLMAATLPKSVFTGPGSYLPVIHLAFVALMGVIALVAIALRPRQSRFAKALLWAATLGVFLGALFPDPVGIGLAFVPSLVLLILSAIGLRPAPVSPGLQV